MSTYAISFLTSDLMAGPSEEGSNVRVFARPALTEETEYARKIAPKALDYYEKTLGVRFPLPKLDLVALPGFNAPVPAETWGLVFYRFVYKIFLNFISHNKKMLFFLERVTSLMAIVDTTAG